MKSDAAARIIAEMKLQEKDFWTVMREHVRTTTSEILQEVINAEFESYIGAVWHSRCPGRRCDRRNGSYRRGIGTLFGDITVRIPRGRKAGFRSLVLRERKRRERAFDMAVREAYVAGLSSRETAAFLYRALGTSVSRSSVGRIVETLDGRRRAFQLRQLDGDYHYLVLDGMFVRCMIAPPHDVAGARKSESVEQVCVLLVRGIKADGTRDTIDFRVAPGESEAAWTALLQNLASRGLNVDSVKLFIHDGSDGIEAAIDSVCGPAAVSQRCVCHKLANVWDAVKDKVAHEQLREDASIVYRSETVQEAQTLAAGFSTTWIGREPAAVAILQSGFEDTVRFLGLPPEHRHWILTTNAIERAIREIRRRTRGMNTFMSLRQLQRSIYIAIEKTSASRRASVPYALWQPARRQKRKTKASLGAIRVKFFENIADQLLDGP